MTENLSRQEKLAEVFGHSANGHRLDSGIAFVPINLRSGSYEIQHPDEGGIDVIDVDQFRSVRELDQYVRRFERRDDLPEDLGRGVA